MYFYDVMSNVADQLTLLPHQSGVYKFLNKDGKVIYVGKAKTLKTVSQYFTPCRNLSVKTRRMVSQVDSSIYGSGNGKRRLTT